MTGRPRVAVLMSPALRTRLITPGDWARLERSADVRAAPAGTEDPGDWGTAALADPRTTVCLTGWDTGPLAPPDLARLPRLGLVAHTGGSVRHLVGIGCYDRGVRVTQAAAVLADGVAEYTVLAVLAGLRRLLDFHHDLTGGTGWDADAAARPGRLLRDQTVGIVGASRVGRATLARLRGFGCRLLLHDPYVDAAGAAGLGADAVDLPTLLRESDVVSLHAPLLPTTRGLLGAAELRMVRDGGLLVNTARAALVDEQALAAELRSGRLRAVLDVFWQEPLAADSPWRSMPGTVVTPHLAALTRETLFEQGSAMIDEIERFAAGIPLRHGIDRAQYDQLA